MKKKMNKLMEPSVAKKVVEALSKEITEKRLAKMKGVLCGRVSNFSIAFENAADDQNASAALRSAECFGVQNVHIIEVLTFPCSL